MNHFFVRGGQASKKKKVEFLKTFLFSQAFQLAAACVFVLPLSSVFAASSPELVCIERK